MWRLMEILNVFSTLTLKQIFWKTKTFFFFFKKLEFRFLVESTRIENASFQHKTAILKANVKIIRMVSTKWTYHKERSFACNFFFFFENFVSDQEPLKQSWFDVATTQMSIFLLL